MNLRPAAVLPAGGRGQGRVAGPVRVSPDGSAVTDRPEDDRPSCPVPSRTRPRPGCAGAVVRCLPRRSGPDDRAGPNSAAYTAKGRQGQTSALPPGVSYVESPGGGGG